MKTGENGEGEILMEDSRFKQLLETGENICVEFKRGGNGFEEDAYQTVCSFLNRFGGDLFLGVMNDGTVIGVPPKAAQDMKRNFIKQVGNPNFFSPTVYLEPEAFNYYGKTIIHVHVPPSAEVHSFKKEIYDRIDDADVKVTATGAIAQMYIRKQNIYTEKKIFPYVFMEDLRLDMLPRIRIMADNTNKMRQYQNQERTGDHPWKGMSDEALLRSAGLYGIDRVTGEKGINLAGVLLLGKDEVIRDVLPAYCTDAQLRRVNVDRYDDREMVTTNLIESCEILTDFGRKHLLDPFYLEGTVRISLREIILREMIGNLMIHREFTSPFMAKFIIEKERMYTENANRSTQQGIITPENLEPEPKNPIIASFFRTIGFAEQLGSGVRNMFKYCKTYGGQDPRIEEKDIFRIVVSLEGGLVKANNDVGMASKDGIVNEDRHVKLPENGIINKNGRIIGDKNGTINEKKPETESREGIINGAGESLQHQSGGLNVKLEGRNDGILNSSDEALIEKYHLDELFDSRQIPTAIMLIKYIASGEYDTIKLISEETGIPVRTASRYVAVLKEKKIVFHEGSRKKGRWILK